MDLVENFALATQEKADPTEYVDKFINYASSAATSAGKELGVGSEQFKSLELETRLWELVASLAINEPADKLGAVLKWLQLAARMPIEPKYMKTVKWQHTKEAVAAAALPGTGRAGQLTELDSDAPLRQKVNIDARDAEADRVVFGYIFDLLLGGHYEEAADICAHTNNWSLKTMIESKPTSLTIATCFGLSKRGELSPQERAVYGLLAGDVETVLPHCTSWEQKFSVYVNCLIKSRLFDDGLPLPHPNVPFTSLAEIISALEPSDGLDKEKFMRNLTCAIILDKLPDFVDQVAEQVISLVRNPTESPLAEDLDLLRVIVHVLIVVGDFDNQRAAVDSPSHFLLFTYIQALVVHGKVQLVPSYIRFLCEADQRDVYPGILADIIPTNQRLLQYQLGCSFGLDMEKWIRLAVACILEEAQFDTPYELGTMASAPEASKADDRLVQGVEWFIDNNMWDDALTTMGFVLRQMFSAHHIRGILHFAERVSIDYIEDKASSTNESRDEVAQFAKLVAAFQAIAKWDYIYNTGIYVVQPVEDTHQAVYAILRVFEDSTDEQLLDIRCTYVPYLLLQLARVLQRSGFAREALKLAVTVANEETQLYVLFQKTGSLGQFIDSLARAEPGGLDRVWSVM